MKKVVSLISIILILFSLFGCANVPQESAPESVIESNVPEPEKEPATVAVCMGSINHPVHRIVQTGFMLKAEELGMNGIISGLDSGRPQEFIDKWSSDIYTNNASGALIFTADDSYYKMMKELKTKGIYTVVPHFVHDYGTAKAFIDKNISCLVTTYGAAAAEYILDELIESGITEGGIGITVNYDDGAGYQFKQTILKSGTNFKVLDSWLEGAELTEATRKVTEYINRHPDIVAAFGTTGGSPKSWAAAMENTGRTDLIVVGMDYTELNMELVENGTISALVCQPLYEEAEACAQALYDLHNGAVFNTSEDTWFEELEAPIADIDDMPHYRDIWQKMYDYFKEG